MAGTTRKREYLDRQKELKKSILAAREENGSANIAENIYIIKRAKSRLLF